MKRQNLVLYRKYRPRTFSEIVGQEHIVQTLTNAIVEGMVSHAYLFAGPRGTGKTTIARLLAKSLNCLNRKEKEFEPCNKCSSCLEIEQGRAIDLMEIDAASHRGIDEIRELRDGIRFSPTKSKYKVFIIDECHQLSKDAANALLKTLEEPPSHAIFILATTEIHKMIPTIVSRCQRFDFRKLTAQEIVKKLKNIVQKEKIKVEEEALNLIALNSDGSIRDAESFLDQAITFAGEEGIIKTEDVRNLLGVVEMSLVSQFVDFLAQKDSKGAIDFLDKVFQKGYDPYEFSKTLINYLRQLLILKVSSNFKDPLVAGFTKEEKEKFREQLKLFQESSLYEILNNFLEAQARMRYSPIPQLPLELAIVESIDLKK
ncbi:DNA polymerase III subunit gamma/tau [bacterium]|nr:DNA polymerase III subunit gamma/tau [bacterium]